MNKKLDDSILDALYINELKSRLDMMESMSEIADTVDALSQEQLKLLVKMYIYDRD